MRDNIFSKSLFILGAMFMTLTVFGQGRGEGSGSGQGRGREHLGSPGQKTVYKNVNSIKIYTSGGEQIFPEQKEQIPSGSGVEEISKVEINPKGARIYFAQKKGPARVVDLKCENCIILVDHFPESGPK